MHVLCFADGGSRGNPGPAAAAALVCTSAGAVLSQKAVFLNTATNNAAEYCAALLAVRLAKAQRATKATVKLDSLLVVNQLMRTWKIKEKTLLPLAEKVWKEVGDMPVVFTHIPRAQNAKADALVNAELNARGHAKSQWH